MSSYLEEQMNLLKFDKRLVEINFKNGSISSDEYKNYLKDIEDDTDKAEKLFQPNEENQSQEETVGDSPDSMTDADGEEKEPEADGASSASNDHFGSGY